MTQQLIIPKTGEIIDPQEPARLNILDVYSEEPVAEEAPRLDWIATISAGYRETGKDGHAGRPVVSRDGTIYLHDPHGRAPALKAALAANGGKRLTIAFPFNNPAAFVQQRFTQYSTTKLLIYGDEYSLTQITENGARNVYEAGTDEYNALRKQCKVTISVYFGLAHWDGREPFMDWDDGIGLYRIRTTSRNSIRSLNAALAHIGAFTRGQIAGIPFDVSLDYRDVSRSTGERSNVPVWLFEMRPPGGVSSRTFVPLLSAAVHEGQRLQLPAPPRAEDEEIAEADFRELGDDEAISAPETDAEAELVARGGRCDAKVWEATWFSTVRDTAFDSDEARAEFIRNFTNGGTGSLSFYLDHASEAEANALIAAVTAAIEAERTAARRERIHATTERTGLSVMDLMQAPDDDGYATPQPPDDGPLFEPADERLEELIAEQEPDVEPVVMPSDKDRTDYARGIALAQRLELDVTEYETDGTETRPQLMAMAKRLKAKVDARTAELAKQA